MALAIRSIASASPCGSLMVAVAGHVRGGASARPLGSRRQSSRRLPRVNALAPDSLPNCQRAPAVRFGRMSPDGDLTTPTHRARGSRPAVPRRLDRLAVDFFQAVVDREDHGDRPASISAVRRPADRPPARASVPAASSDRRHAIGPAACDSRLPAAEPWAPRPGHAPLSDSGYQNVESSLSWPPAAVVGRAVLVAPAWMRILVRVASARQASPAERQVLGPIDDGC